MNTHDLDRQQLKIMLKDYEDQLKRILQIQTSREKYQKYLDRLPITEERLRSEVAILNEENSQIRYLEEQIQVVKNQLRESSSLWDRFIEWMGFPS